MMNRHNIAYYFREGFTGIFSHGFMSFASVSVMVACLVLTGTILMVVLSINATISDMSKLGDIRVYIDESYTEEEAKAIEDRIFAVNNVARLEFISNTEALKELKAEFQQDSWLFDGLEYDNPLRHSFHIWVMDINKYNETVKEIDKIPGIASVISASSTVSTLVRVRDVLSTASIGFMALLGTVAIFIIANTIKLTTFDRREEIAIMKMVGATNWFIQAPFTIESVILSQLSAGIAFGLQYLIYRFIIQSGLSGIEQITIIAFEDIKYYYLAGFCAFAFVFGVIGSSISTRKFLKV